MTRRWHVGRAAAAAGLALLLAGCTLTGTPPAPAAAEAAVVYVIGRGWHSDIAIPAEAISGPLAGLEQGFPGVRFLTFGFGERTFLVARRITLPILIAALLPSRSALLVTALKATPEAAFGASNVVALRVSRPGLDRIVARLWRELEISAGGAPRVLASGPYPGSVFYAARDTYDALHTCNTWTAETLRAGGLPVPSAGVLFARRQALLRPV
jgi:uncharacterized protein (TIGR02117 family)